MTSTLDRITVRASRPTASSIFERATNAATQKALGKVASAIPASARKHLPLARKLMSGGVAGLVDAGLDRLFEKVGINGTLLPGGGADGPAALLGGISLADARRLFEEHSSIVFAKRNLFCIRVRNIQGGDPLDINMFATDVSYPAFTVQGDAVQVGTGSFDTVTGSERREMRVTTLDDMQGSVKNWFWERHNAMCHPDGTSGLPVEYVFRVDVLHAFFDERADGATQGRVDTFVMRPGAMDHDKSRRDDGLEEVQMTFTQWDTFATLT